MQEKCDYLSLDINSEIDLKNAILEIKNSKNPELYIYFNVSPVDSSCTIDLFKDFTDQLANNSDLKKLDVTFAHNNGLTIEQSKLLSKPEILKKLLVSSRRYLDFMIIDEEVVNFVLADENIKNMLSDFKPNTQMFSTSCAAHAIMSILASRNEVPYSGLTEFQIYKEIWSATGKIACPYKIKLFMEKMAILQF